MKCPLCHSEDTADQSTFILCYACGRVYLKATEKQDVLDNAADSLGKSLGGMFLDMVLGVTKEAKENPPQRDKLDKIHTDFELHRLVRDVERGVNRP